MKKSILALTFALSNALLSVSCSGSSDPNDPTAIRKWMEEQQIKYAPSSFISAVSKGEHYCPECCLTPA